MRQNLKHTQPHSNLFPPVRYYKQEKTFIKLAFNDKISSDQLWTSI
jgi:hypothetical protein